MPFLGAFLLSLGVLTNTLLVSAHNLGAREDIGYINGGKIFRLQGTMWYHIPGLTDIGLAPQNIGAQINLRNNEYAMFQQRLRSVSLVDVDFALAENALLHVALDYKDHTSQAEDEGSFWAARLSAVTDEQSPLINALVRYEHGRVTERIELGELGRTLSPGDHRLTIELNKNGTLTATVDGKTQNVPFQIDAITPYVALGSGEQTTTIMRWRVVGVDDQGDTVDWEEEFSIWSTIKHRLRPVLGLALLAWFILFGLPIAKVSLESRINPLTLVPDCMSRPMPRLIFGALCLLPWMPLLMQWIMGGLYVVFVWMSVWERLEYGPWTLGQAQALKETENKEQTTFPPRNRIRWIVAGLTVIAIGAALLGARMLWRSSILGTTIPNEASVDEKILASKPSMDTLKLGERITLEMPNIASEGDSDARGLPDARLAFRVQLGPGETLRAGLLQSLPPQLDDVYQVDRSQGPVDEQDFELHAVSTLVSSVKGLPGELRKLDSDKVSRSPHGGWVLEPKEYEVVISCRPPIAQVTVGGKLIDYRTDLSHNFRIGGIQLLSQSASVTAVGDIRMTRAVDDEVGSVHQTAVSGEAVGFIGVLVLVLGLFLLGVGVVIQLEWSVPNGVMVLKKGLRAYALFAVWLVIWLCYRLGWLDSIFLGQFAEWLGEGGQIALGVCTLVTGTLNLGHTLRWSRLDTSWKSRTATAMAMVLIGITAFEAMAYMAPERRHNWTTYWNHGTTPPHYWVYDPMIRRLNPWFIDMRFKRQDYAAVQPDAKTRKKRIIVFGGSQTYGWGIPSRDKDAFSAKLQEGLTERGHTNVEVINAAFPGVKTATGLRWFAGNIIRYEPDIVVINFVVNEFMNVDQYHVWSNENVENPADPEQPMATPLASLATSALFQRFRGDVMDSHLGQILAADVYETYEMEQYLSWWHRIAEEHNIQVVFSIEPTNMYVESAGKVIMRGETSLGGAQDTYRHLGETLNVPVYDVLNHFVQEQENLWFYDTMHMSRLGHRVFAQHLAGMIHCKLLCACSQEKCSDCEACKPKTAPTPPSP